MTGAGRRTLPLRAYGHPVRLFAFAELLPPALILLRHRLPIAQPARLVEELVQFSREMKESKYAVRPAWPSCGARDLQQAGKTPTRGFGGRIYFYDAKNQPIAVEGQLWFMPTTTIRRSPRTKCPIASLPSRPSNSPSTIRLRSWAHRTASGFPGTRRPAANRNQPRARSSRRPAARSSWAALAQFAARPIHAATSIRRIIDCTLPPVDVRSPALTRQPPTRSGACNRRRIVVPSSRRGQKLAVRHAGTRSALQPGHPADLIPTLPARVASKRMSINMPGTMADRWHSARPKSALMQRMADAAARSDGLKPAVRRRSAPSMTAPANVPAAPTVPKPARCRGSASTVVPGRPHNQLVSYSHHLRLQAGQPFRKLAVRLRRNRSPEHSRRTFQARLNRPKPRQPRNLGRPRFETTG